jgi:Suppressor of fused protein (SUFU)
MDDDEWNRVWAARQAALESVLGPAENSVLHAVIPFELGGNADVLCFRKLIGEQIAATCELLGEPSQTPNSQGTYELAIAHRDENQWGPNIIAKLARYTCDAVLEPGETMDIGPAVPAKSTIAAFLFDDFKRMSYEGQDAGVLLCIGLTADEAAACLRGNRQEVYDALKAQNVFPYTDLFRPSVLKPRGGFWRRLTGGGA